MPKLFRIVLMLISAVILLGLVSLIGLVVFVNPNDLKPQISQAVTQFTGRQLHLDGNIQWSIFPWLGLQLNDASLANSPGFGRNPLAQIKKLDIQVRLLPLFHKQLEIGKLQLNGLALYLVKNAQGHVNWEGPWSSSSKTTPTHPDSHPLEHLKPLGFIVAGLGIRNGHIIYADQQKNKRYEITHLQLKSTHLAVNKRSPVDIQFNLNTNASMKAAVKLRSTLLWRADDNQLELNPFHLNTFLQDARTPKKELPFSLKGNIFIDLNKQTLNADKLMAFINHTPLTGHILGQNFLNNPYFTGSFTSPHMNVGRFVFKKMQLGFQFKDNLLTLKPIQGQFYQGHYQGDATINFNSKNPFITAQSQFNQINTASLFRDLTNMSQIQLAGLASLNFTLTTQGNTAESFIKNLNGQGQFNIDHGALKGINVSYWISFGKALLRHQVAPKKMNAETPFDQFNGRFTIVQGILNNPDLVIRSGRLRVHGKGVLNLPQQHIDYELMAQPLLADGSPEGVAIPIRISGPLQQVVISPILDQLSVGIIKEKLKGKLENTLKKLDLNKLFP
ncbi:AsmA family protein [Rickettsiella grylli]|uniref:AsmA family n=1 Tax=Rickettsiella grylli TaxID=59196 RepID=A8PLB0_9COXI|nr:AsmA family protein [Rickettsiella grylli]EDP45974.1 AsmA family [Rickettsiella grylli]